jgi:hypothetical protein
VTGGDDDVDVASRVAVEGQKDSVGEEVAKVAEDDGRRFDINRRLLGGGTDSPARRFGDMGCGRPLERFEHVCKYVTVESAAECSGST